MEINLNITGRNEHDERVQAIADCHSKISKQAYCWIGVQLFLVKL